MIAAGVSPEAQGVLALFLLFGVFLFVFLVIARGVIEQTFGDDDDDDRPRGGGEVP